MKYNKKKYPGIMLLTLLVLCFPSCELTTLDEPGTEVEDEPVAAPEPGTIPSSIAEFETLFHGDSQLTWSAVSFTLAGFGGLQDCRLDDMITVKSDGTYEYDGGEVLCGAEDSEQRRTGTWQIVDNGNNIVFDEGTSREHTAKVNGLEAGSISLSGQYLGLEIKGIYASN